MSQALWDELPPAEAKLVALELEHLELSEKLRDREQGEFLAGHFVDYVKAAWPAVERGRLLRWNWHIEYICEYLEAVSAREINRLVINIPPRCMKSLNVSVFWPTWTWTHTPGEQFLTLSNAEKLAMRDAVKSRRLIQSDWYQDRWGHVYGFAADQNAKGRYENDQGGHRIAFGFGASIIGEGGDTIIIDDPHDVDGAQSEVERQNALTTFDEEVYGRLNDQVTGAIVIIMQRLHEKDLSGHVLQDADEWEHLCIPMEYEPQRYVSSIGLDDPRTEPGELMWEDRFPKKAVNRWKNRLAAYGASGQLQQRPTPGEGGILKRPHWRPWKNRKLPECDYIVQVYDTAFGEKEENDYSACTTWGMFQYDDASKMVGEGRYNVILLDYWKDRVTFPALKTQVRRSSEEHDPDMILVEPKASGKSLVQEMSRVGLPMQEWTPTRSQGRGGKEVDKVARAHIASTVLAGGAVWYPTQDDAGNDLKWPLELIENCAAFPKAEHDDDVDTCVIAWLWLRYQWRVELEDDPEDEEPPDETPREPPYG